MPELPDVEGFRRYAARYARGKRIGDVRVADADIVRNASGAAFRRALRNQRFASPERHGKWLLAKTDGPTVMFHFGMTGLLRWTASGSERGNGAHDRVVFDLDDGSLIYRSQRRLGGVWLARDEDEQRRVTGELGPDAAGIPTDDFAARLATRRGGVKAALMDQSLIAGIGNELSDEVLWRARTHPSTACHDLSERDVRNLHGVMVRTIKDANRHGRIPATRGWLEAVRGEDSPRCPRCRTGIRRTTVAGRTSYWCPQCQPRASRRKSRGN